jgi:hypothetical protein
MATQNNPTPAPRPAEAQFTKAYTASPAAPAPVADAAPVDDFISAYALWATRFEMPCEVNEALATQVVASLLNSSRVSIEGPGYEVTLDLWLSVFADSGLGKGIATGELRRVIDAAGIGDLIENNTWGSKEAFYQQLSGREVEWVDGDEPGRGRWEACYNDQAKFYIWGEFASVLTKFTSPAFSGVKEALTDMYDNTHPPAKIEYSQTGGTPAIDFPHPPRTNILALSTPEWFHGNLEDADARSGFLSWWTYVTVPGVAAPVAVADKLDISQIPPVRPRSSTYP